jgi:hypothetical protein
MEKSTVAEKNDRKKEIFPSPGSSNKNKKKEDEKNFLKNMAVEEKYIVQDLSWLFCCLSL